jgi:hypothetical protein
VGTFPTSRAIDAQTRVVHRDVTSAAGPVAQLAFDSVERIDAPTGASFVIPVDLETVRAHAPRLLLDDGLELASTLFRVDLTGTTNQPSDPWAAWLPASATWRASPVTLAEARAALSAGDAPAGFALLVEPKAGRRDSAVWIAKERVPLQWLSSPEAMSANPDLWSPLLSPGVESQQPHLRALIDREAASPLTRWRALLLRTGLRPSRGEGSGGEGTVVQAFDDVVIETLASQIEHRLRIALMRLWEHDPALCARLRARLGAVAQVAPNVRAPVWPTDEQAIDRLLMDLLNPQYTPARKTQAAEQWLNEQPQATAWVSDDAGALVTTSEGTDGAAQESTTATEETPRQPVASVNILNLGERPQLVWVARDEEAMPRDLAPLPAMHGAVIGKVSPLTRSERSGPLASAEVPTVRAHLGEWSRRVALMPGPLSARAPGLSTGTFIPDHTLESLLAGATPPAEQGWETAALLYRPARAADAPPHASEADGWELFVESRVPVDVSERGAESLMVYLGPTGEPRAVLRIGHDGSLSGAPGVERAEVVNLEDRWTARVKLPGSSVEEDGLLRVGLARIDARNLRSAWPRAMTPWQMEPARAAVQLLEREMLAPVEAPEPR